MAIESIREFNRAVAFVPYDIQMASGEHYTVPHPEFVFVSPRGNFVLVLEEDGRQHHLNWLLIERASLRNGQHRRKRSKRK